MAARARGGSGATGYAVALVVFVVLFVLSLLLTIIFYAQWSKAARAQALVDGSRTEFVTSEEAKSDAVVRIKGNGAPGSVVGKLLDENGKLKNQIAGDADMSMDILRARLQEAGLAEGQILLQTIATLRQEKAAQGQELANLKRDFEDATKKFASIGEVQGKSLEEFNIGVANAKRQVADQQAQFDAFNKQVKQTVAELEGRVSELQAQNQQTSNRLTGVIEQKDQQIFTLQRRIDDLTKPGVKPELRVDPSLMPDGQILSVVPEENLVFINRGRLDHIVLGMTFEVFSANTLPSRDEFGDMRGKATVEVVGMDEHSARARVVRVSRGGTFTEGDIIANVVYDPNATLRFFVFGDYDIDRTGNPTAADRRRIETMVNEWGGKIAEQLTYETDFLVLGVEPKAPDPLPREEFNAEVIAAHEAAVRKYTAYQNLVAEAKALRIPILNQNRFLALVGYYQRQPSRAAAGK